MAPERGALRLTRVALFALAAVGLACAAHLVGGETVSLVPALIAVPAVMVVINLLASARRGPGILLLAMGLTQTGLHLAFMAASITRGCHIVTPAMGGMAGPAGQSPVVVSCGPEMAHGGSAAGGLWPSTSMLLAHGLASVVLAMLLAYGESALWALAALLRFRLLLPDAVLRLPVEVRLPVPAAMAFRPRPSVPRCGVRRRGPPVMPLAAC